MDVKGDSRLVERFLRSTMLGSSVLFLLGVMGLVVGTFGMWNPPQGWVAYNPARYNGIAIGWGWINLGVAGGVLMIAARYGWSYRTAVGLIGTGVLLTTGYASAIVVNRWDGMGVYLSLVGALTFVVAGSVVLELTSIRSLPRPLLGFNLPSRILGALTAAGTLLVATWITVNASLPLLQQGIPGIGVLGLYLATFGAAAGFLTWCRTVGAFSTLLGVGFGVLALYSFVAVGRLPLLLLAGATLLFMSGALELTGANQ